MIDQELMNQVSREFELGLDQHMQEWKESLRRKLMAPGEAAKPTAEDATVEDDTEGRATA